VGWFLYVYEVGVLIGNKVRKRLLVLVCFGFVNGNYYAVGSECTHFGGDLSEGVLEDKGVTCPNHRAKFDVPTGKVVSPPAEALGLPDIEDLPIYFVKVENQDIMIKV
jgi:nitrite reductase/ring-hydroxylating ferredoxin subunit